MPNRLALETSPYLRQHADNPVDWYPWGDEVFAAARERDRPILLSVGYSSCHWCHVMAHESFEDEAIAAVMNDRFVNVKVDREERPDVDAIYMDAVLAMTGRGGWPMTVLLTPDGRPFFAGTYFPKASGRGMVSFPELLARIDELWRDRRADLVEQADTLTDAMRQGVALATPPEGHGDLHLDLVEALARLRAAFDPAWGGFGHAPKFPQTMSLELLLRAHAAGADTDTDTEVTSGGDPGLLEIVTTSLDAMAAGGIYDHLGGGFARYSVDERWLVPHFEKMLYDQALLARAYLHAWQLTGEDRHLQVVDEVIGYVLGQLRQAGGGLASAEDADSEGVEGRFYVWSESELRQVLDDAGLADVADEAVAWWGVTPQGNFEGANILWRPVRGDLARPAGVERARQALFEHRARRVRPGLDDKVLTEWNGLFLATLAEAAMATGRADWLDAAAEGGRFLLAALRRPDGRWLRSWQLDPTDGPTPDGHHHGGGTARHLAYAADHAAALDAFLRLAEATGEARWVDEARSVADALLELFWDPEQGALFTTGSDAEELVARPKDLLDNATPAANSLAADGLARLGTLVGEPRYLEHARQIVGLLASSARQHPQAFAHLLGVAQDLSLGLTEVVVAGDRPDLVAAVQRRYRPGTVLAWGERFDSPLWEARDDGRAYVCQGYACQVPATDLATLTAQLDGA
jgi:uncharacterized protein YyaL (SSP411 family)